MLRFLLFTCLVGYCVDATPRLRRPLLDGRIVGGSDAEIEDLPYHVSFQYASRHICSASIISENWVVTSGRCIDGISVAYVTFLAGTSFLWDIDGSVHQAEILIANPDYDYYTLDFDVAVARVSVPFVYGPAIQPIALIKSEPAAGVISTVSGWGTLSFGGSLSLQLQVVSIPIVDRQSCDQAYFQYGGITENMICAGLEEGGKDSCQGDTGSPLVIGGELAGIVSWGVGCALPAYPRVYSNVASLREFITNVTGVE